jgi:heme A synthase
VQLRFIHPALAFGVGAYIAMAAWIAVRQRPSPMARRLAWGVTGLFVVQLIAGVVNVWLQVPVWMQLLHLLLADLVWIAWVMLGAVVLNEASVEASEPTPRPSYSPQPG